MDSSSEDVEEEPEDEQSESISSHDDEEFEESLSASEEGDSSDPEDGSFSTLAALLSRVAILGDSPSALFTAFALFGLALGIVWNQNTRVSPQDPYAALGPLPQIGPSVIYAAPTDPSEPEVNGNMLRLFKKDGVIAVRGLIGDDLLLAMDMEANELVDEQIRKNLGKQRRPGTQFHTVVHGALFQRFNATDNNSQQGANGLSAFFKAATLSKIPKVAAQLLGISNSLESSTSMRVLRDIFLSKDNDPYVCGWHVDDLGFWPATPDAPGVNAWIALDDMPLQGGGGFALAVGSHEASWKDEAHFVTGASTNFPSEGYSNVSDMFARRTGSGTCSIKTTAPHLHRRMEETKRQYAVQRGDVIFHTRWLFHRTVPFDRGSKYAKAIFRRYSVRYNLGSAVVPKGYGVEPSVLWDDSNGGKTADQVCQNDGPWYPKAWPPPTTDDLSDLEPLKSEKFPVAEQRRMQRIKEMKPYLQNLGRIATSATDPIKPIYDDQTISY